ncbi:unnamed protein product [Ceratitis capitata]|uniref:(Mediterranean fruit fly) hypothetical protein n=1 Tax=Ceratitis capitata TaxID=7213 RepID=A0A811UCI8_CERCA|nr:unnamed protein product [Ceratitis capitata]
MSRFSVLKYMIEFVDNGELVIEQREPGNITSQAKDVDYAMPADILDKLETPKLTIDFEHILHNFDKLHHHNNNNNSYTTFKSANFSAFDNKGRHACERRCQANQPLTCHYRLVVHHYQALTAECESCFNNDGACPKQQCIYADGVYTPIVAINQMLPGPTIALALAWHVHVPHARNGWRTVCYAIPKQPAEAFRYQFNAERAGSLCYNSHVGLQRSIGVGGGFIIRQPVESDRQSYLYDYDLPEHTLLLQDYVYGQDVNRVRNILINGKGRNHVSNLSDRDPRHRYERLQVARGNRYRFRIIYNGVFNCPIEFSVENHRMLMISTDGNDIVPVLADSFFMAAGERFDFVLQANQQSRSYWIKVRGYESCAKENLYQGAILTYQSGPTRALPQQPMMEASICDNGSEEYFILGDYEDQLKKFVSLSQSGCGRADFKATNVATVGLRSLEQVPWTRDTAFFTHYTLLGNRVYGGAADVAYQIDDISYKSSKISLLQTNGLYNEIGVFCNRSMLSAKGQNCETKSCICTNVVRLPAYRALEIVLVNNNNEPTPVHLHGYTFRLVGQNALGSVVDEKQVKDLDRRGLLQRSTDDFPIQKDTVQVPPLGYAIVRFYSSNPGYWMYHSALDSQSSRGMIGVYKIGEDHQIKEVPPRLRC